MECAVRRVVATALAGVLAFACSPGGGGDDAGDAADGAGDDGGVSTGIVCPSGTGEGAPVALFDPFGPMAARATPIPNDVWTVADPTTPTGRRLHGAFSSFDTAFSYLDGFGLAAPIAAPFAGILDPATIEGTSGATSAPRLFLLDLEGLGTPSAADLAARLVPVEMAVAQEGTALVFPFRRVFAVRALAPLAPMHRYAMVATSCIADAVGRGLRGDTAFLAVRDGGAIDARFEPVRADVEPVLAYLEDPAIGLDRGSVALVSVFTTQSVYDDLQAMAAEVAARPAADLTVTRTYPATDGAGNLNPDMLADYPGLAEQLADLPLEEYFFDAIDTVAVGTFAAPRFLGDDDILERDADGRPRVARDETLEFLVTFPAEDLARGIVPPFRTVVYQHAFTTCKETTLALADTFARFGIALVGIDMPMHGSRHPDGPGGCSLDSMLFFDTANFARTSDRLRQGVSDVLALVRALRHGAPLDALPVPGGDGVADLDVARLAIAGQSMGGSVLFNVLALTPELGAGVSNVGGGVFTNLMLAGMIEGDDDALDLPSLELTHVALALGAQTAAEKADPVHYAMRLLHDPLDVGGASIGTKQLLYQEAVDESILPNLSTEITARAMGIPLVEPVAEAIAGLEEIASPVEGNLADGGTAGLYQFVGAEHEFLLSAGDAPALMRAGQLQAAIFLRSYIDAGVGVIVDPFSASQVAPHDPGNLPWSLP